MSVKQIKELAKVLELDIRNAEQEQAQLTIEINRLKSAVDAVRATYSPSPMGLKSANPGVTHSIVFRKNGAGGTLIDQILATFSKTAWINTRDIITQSGIKASSVYGILTQLAKRSKVKSRKVGGLREFQLK